MIPIVRKLTRYAAYAGHNRSNAPTRSVVSGGTRNSRTRSVAAIAKTPSLKASRRVVRMATVCRTSRRNAASHAIFVVCVCRDSDRESGQILWGGTDEEIRIVSRRDLRAGIGDHRVE